MGVPNMQQPELRRAYKRILDYQLIYSGWNIWSEKMSDMSISGSLDSSGGVQSHHSETSGNSSAGKLSTDLKSVTNSTEQTSEGLSRASSASRLPEGQFNIQPSACIRVLQVPGGRAQINQMGGSGNSGTSTSLKINEPAAPTCQTSEISGSGSPVILGNTSPEWLKKNVIDYVDSLKREFNYWLKSEFPARVIKIQKYAEDIVFLKNELKDVNNWIYHYLDFSNRDELNFSYKYRNACAQKLSESENIYAEEIKTLSADWKISTETNWSDKDTLRLVVMETFFSYNLGCLLSDADIKKYVPVIFSGGELIQDIVHCSARISSDEEGEAKVRSSSSISEKTDLPFTRVAEGIHGNSPGDEDMHLTNAIKFLKNEIVNEIDFEQPYDDIDGKLVARVIDSYLVSQKLEKVSDGFLTSRTKKYFYDNMDKIIDEFYPKMNKEIDLKQQKGESLSDHFKILFIQMAKYKAVVEYSRRVEHPRNL
jgi:hypothetical protein